MLFLAFWIAQFVDFLGEGGLYSGDKKHYPEELAMYLKPQLKVWEA